MAESPKQVQKKITSYSPGPQNSQDSSDAFEETTPKKSSLKKLKMKRISSSESEALVNENPREASSHNGDAKTTIPESPSSSSLQAPWTMEEENSLFESVEKHLREQESQNTKKPVYLKSIDWDNIPLKCGNHTLEQSKARFTTLSNRVRKMRTGLEILQDMKDQHKKPVPPSARKRKLVTDPDMPKKPLTAYFQFTMDKRAKMAEKHPGLDTVELAKKLSKRWNKLSDEKKQKYTENYRKAMEEYQHQMIEYFQTHPNSDASPPQSGFELWSVAEAKEIKNDRPDISEKKLNKKLKRRWENLDDEDKEKWYVKEKGELQSYKKRLGKAAKKKADGRD